MKRRMEWIGVLVAGCAAAVACATPVGEPAATAPSADPGSGFFSDALSPYGGWMWLEGPGMVWYPYNVPIGWRPYVLGRWVYTEYGWTWVSDEEWGWAVYHYGRWHYDPRYGWVWVPGSEWGPAWVVWHEGGGYVGWAPLPWRVRWRAGVGLDWGGIDLYAILDPTWWCFTETRYLVGADLHRRIVPSVRNVTLIKITKNVTKYTVVEKRVVNQGVGIEAVARAAGRPVRRLRLGEADSPEAAGGGKVRGTELVLFRPDVSKDRPPRARKATERETGASTAPDEAPTARRAPGAGSSGSPAERARWREEETRRLKSQQARESEELERIHAQEGGAPPPGVSHEEINRRQDEEHRALRDKQERERRLLEERIKRQESGKPHADRPGAAPRGSEGSKPKGSGKPDAGGSDSGKSKKEKPEEKPGKP